MAKENRKTIRRKYRYTWFSKLPPTKFGFIDLGSGCAHLTLFL